MTASLAQRLIAEAEAEAEAGVFGWLWSLHLDRVSELKISRYVSREFRHLLAAIVGSGSPLPQKAYRRAEQVIDA